MQRLRLGIHHLLDLGEGLGAAAFHHIGSQGPGTAGEADQRHFALQLATNGAYRIHHIAQLVFRIRNGNFLYIGHAGKRTFKLGALACLKVKAQSHGIGNGQNIGKQNGRIERKTAQRLQCYFTGQLGILAQRHKVAGFGPGRLVLGQIAARLAHHPYRGIVYRLA